MPDDGDGGGLDTQRRLNSRLAFRVLELLCMKNEPISHSVLKMLQTNLEQLSKQPETANTVNRLKELVLDGLLIVPTNVLASFTKDISTKGSLQTVGLSMQNWKNCMEIALRILNLALVNEDWELAPVMLMKNVELLSKIDQNPNATKVLDYGLATDYAQIAKDLLVKWSGLDSQPMEQ